MDMITRGSTERQPGPMRRKKKLPSVNGNSTITPVKSTPTSTTPTTPTTPPSPATVTARSLPSVPSVRQLSMYTYTYQLFKSLSEEKSVLKKTVSSDIKEDCMVIQALTRGHFLYKVILSVLKCGLKNDTVYKCLNKNWLNCYT